MKNRQPTLLEVLHASFFKSNPKRDEVTKIVIQPDTDEFDQDGVTTTGQEVATDSSSTLNSLAALNSMN